MRFIELFAGIGGFRYGLEEVHDLSSSEKHEHEEANSSSGGEGGMESKPANGLGNFTCVWSNEIDKYACQIYRRHYEDAKEAQSKNCPDCKSGASQHSRCPLHKGTLYEGDITRVDTKDIPEHDLLVGGFPCQAFSIAGNRLGFADIRGTLFFEIVRILRDKKPRCVLLENVKGLLSHDSGQTFQTILKTLSDIGYRVEWQVLNSKHFGVPQNRERVFIIGHLRGGRRGQVFPIRQGNETCDIEDRYKLPKYLNTIRGNQAQYSNQNFVDYGAKIRRLTPTECERLQGFPDGWTEGISDTQRYKCLGNAVSTTVITEIGKKIYEICRKTN